MYVQLSNDSADPFKEDLVEVILKKSCTSRSNKCIGNKSIGTSSSQELKLYLRITRKLSSELESEFKVLKEKWNKRLKDRLLIHPLG